MGRAAEADGHFFVNIASGNLLLLVLKSSMIYPVSAKQNYVVSNYSLFTREVEEQSHATGRGFNSQFKYPTNTKR